MDGGPGCVFTDGRPGDIFAPRSPGAQPEDRAQPEARGAGVARRLLSAAPGRDDVERRRGRAGMSEGREAGGMR